ncbi:MAG TPA: hypothetical protein VK901_15035 [Nitrospiraceae bacterium]|nr:hypothetical protein [Nitrospiraceae bacterium]
MGRRMRPKESECGGTMKQIGSGEVVLSLPATEQLSTRSCARCAGLLVPEWYYDLENTGVHHLETLRCVQCGHRVDPIILQNQIQPQVERQPERQARPRYSTRAGMLSELA